MPYELRHTAITHEADAGWSSFEIADWAGGRHVGADDQFPPRHRCGEFLASDRVTPVSDQMVLAIDRAISGLPLLNRLKRRGVAAGCFPWSEIGCRDLGL